LRGTDNVQQTINYPPAKLKSVPRSKIESRTAEFIKRRLLPLLVVVVVVVVH
jgi:hypothetical protein